jgi:hypothetical protein
MVKVGPPVISPGGLIIQEESTMPHAESAGDPAVDSDRVRIYVVISISCPGRKFHVSAEWLL